MDIPDPRYVKTDDGTYIAYQVVGDGPVDIAWQFDFGGNLDVWWDSAWDRAWFEGLASFGRLILHDWRATGLSSRNVAVPNLETRAADLLAVLDAAGSKNAVMGAVFESLAPCVLLAATAPERARALVWWSPSPRTTWAPDYVWGDGPDEVALELEALEHWGTSEYGRLWADAFEQEQGVRPPEEAVRWQAKRSRNTCTPDVAVELQKIWWQTDIRGVLPTVQVPILLIVDEGGSAHPAITEQVASLMPHAVVEGFPLDLWPVSRDEIDRVNRPRLEAIQRFLGVQPHRASIDRFLSTVLFTDIVGSTHQQASIGDRGWKELIERHHAIVREALADWRGVESDTAGDGFYATFDGPARAIHCALEIRDRVRDLGIQIRAGVHTGECELIDGKAGGITVTTGARISALADPSQVLVSQTVKDLVAGSGLSFEPTGEHDLKGVPDRWRLYAATSDPR
jgi:class 3 adenylate cyclase/pimeloyl-ACP methyl ester carboxylesterase